MILQTQVNYIFELVQVDAPNADNTMQELLDAMRKNTLRSGTMKKTKLAKTNKKQKKGLGKSNLFLADTHVTRVCGTGLTFVATQSCCATGRDAWPG